MAAYAAAQQLGLEVQAEAVERRSVVRYGQEEPELSEQSWDMDANGWAREVEFWEPEDAEPGETSLDVQESAAVLCLQFPPFCERSSS